jgi:hypothetical protein
MKSAAILIVALVVAYLVDVEFFQGRYSQATSQMVARIAQNFR